jgi:hypothetical protein
MATQAKERRTRRASLNPHSRFGQNQHSGFRKRGIADLGKSTKIVITA